MSESIKVDIWSDIACPWCYIGKRKFEAGVDAFKQSHPGANVEVEYHSFELSPDTPVDFDGNEVDFLASHKGMARDQVEGMLEHVAGIAAATGLKYDFPALKHTNTVKAHQLLHWAKSLGKQVELKERLLAAYFTEGQHVGKDEQLAKLAAEVGLDHDEALAVLAENRYLADVRADQAQATELGISGVPFFVLNERYGVSGAQEAATFEKVLTQVASEA